jgi:uncharacterized membrane protein YeaQ/YmgE (transglycosylase-associated protein family)
MKMEGIGWIGAIIVGGIAGWLAEQMMKSNMGLLMNILLGIVGVICPLLSGPWTNLVWTSQEKGNGQEARA